MFGWVRLPGLPYHYYHKHVLRTIGEAIGQVLKIDYNTIGVSKARFARMAVKIDLTQPLVSMVKLDGITQFVKYEGLPTICYGCGRYGHLEPSCPHKEREPTTSSPGVPPVAEPKQAGADPTIAARDKDIGSGKFFGVWMKEPTRRPACQGMRGPAPTQPHVPSGNRFDILASSSTEHMHQDRTPDTATAAPEAVTVAERFKRQKKQVWLPKSKGEKGKSFEQVLAPKKAITTKPGPTKTPKDSLFTSAPYLEIRQSTLLDAERNSVITLMEPNNLLQPTQTRTRLPNPIAQSMTAQGKENKKPKPPDKGLTRNGFKIHSPLKVQNTGPRPKDASGAPSDELAQSLTEALNDSQALTSELC